MATRNTDFELMIQHRRHRSRTEIAGRFRHRPYPPIVVKRHQIQDASSSLQSSRTATMHSQVKVQDQAEAEEGHYVNVTAQPQAEGVSAVNLTHQTNDDGFELVGIAGNLPKHAERGPATSEVVEAAPEVVEVVNEEALDFCEHYPIVEIQFAPNFVWVRHHGEVKYKLRYWVAIYIFWVCVSTAGLLLFGLIWLPVVLVMDYLIPLLAKE